MRGATVQQRESTSSQFSAVRLGFCMQVLEATASPSLEAIPIVLLSAPSLSLLDNGAGAG